MGSREAGLMIAGYYPHINRKITASSDVDILRILNIDTIGPNMGMVLAINLRYPAATFRQDQRTTRPLLQLME